MRGKRRVLAVRREALLLQGRALRLEACAEAGELKAAARSAAAWGKTGLVVLRILKSVVRGKDRD